MVKLYSRTGCPQCRMTKRAFASKGIAYTEINITEHPEYIAELKEKGYSSLPVVDTGTTVWTGFQPEKIKLIA